MRPTRWPLVLLVALAIPGLGLIAASSDGTVAQPAAARTASILDDVDAAVPPDVAPPTAPLASSAQTHGVDVLEIWDVDIPDLRTESVNGIGEEQHDTLADTSSAAATATDSSAGATSSPPTESPDPTPAAPESSTSEPSAPAPPEPEPCDYACRGEQILAANPLQPPPGWTITFEGPSTLLGLAYGAPRREIVMWLRDDLSDHQIGATLLHEVGHAWDFAGLNGQGNTARQTWAEMRGFTWVDSNLWFGFGLDVTSDFGLGAGDLAESVQACWGPGWDTFRSTLAPPPTADQCAWLRGVIG